MIFVSPAPALDLTVEEGNKVPFFQLTSDIVPIVSHVLLAHDFVAFRDVFFLASVFLAYYVLAAVWAL